ncbi:MAG: methionyl-tRNA formyltransferase, partial [Daejeonella sp.]|uniref:methionyl-tRNA formyltransferase n=1 Tax=Daejeonella sp. TaxID=2805397 RepID=UPI003C795F96
LHDKLMETGAGLLVKTVKAIEAGHYTEQPQADSDNLKSAPKIFKEDCLIKWDQPVEQVFNFIRGLSPYPTSFTHLDGKILKIFSVLIDRNQPPAKPGTFLTDNKTYLKFACSNGFISILELQLEGKKRMKIDEFLRGVRL